MSDDIILVDQEDILDPIDYEPPQSKRPLAERILAAAVEEVYADSMGRKVRKLDYLSQMVWDAVTFGEIVFADGRKIIISDYDEWLKTAQWLMGHIDGPATRDTTQGVNIYKVYVGVDESMV